MQQMATARVDLASYWAAVVEMATGRRRGEVDDAGAFALRGEELRTARLEVRLTQRELAMRLSYSPSSVCGWEHDRHRVPESVWELILAEFERERAKWGGRRRRLQA